MNALKDPNLDLGKYEAELADLNRQLSTAEAHRRNNLESSIAHTQGLISTIVQIAFEKEKHAIEKEKHANAIAIEKEKQRTIELGE